MSSIIIPKVDETPALAYASLRPIMDFVLDHADTGIEIKEMDISLAGRILAAFPEGLKEEQIVTNDLAVLAETVLQPDTNIVKLPNISAVESQLVEAIEELQRKGYNIPDYPAKPAGQEEADIKRQYEKVLGSVANPALRAGNSYRFIPQVVIDYTRDNPHAMGEWAPDSKTEIAHMTSGDFRSTEKSSTIGEALAGKKTRIEFVDESGAVTILKENMSFKSGDIVDAAIMDRAALRKFLDEKIAFAKENNVALSVHLKATMMIKTDGRIFGDVVEAYLKPVFDAHGEFLKKIGVDSKKGLSDLNAKLDGLKGGNDAALISQIKQEIADCVDKRAPLAVADVKKGLSNLDAPNLVIADVSQANLARWAKVDVASGGMQDTLAIMPDSTYAPIYQAGIDFFKKNGALDPRTMGHVQNIGLMAGGAEEYGSKGTTFEIQGKGVVRIIADDNGHDIVVNEQAVNKGDIWRMCKTGDAAVQNWIQVGIERAKSTGLPTIFWLDETRPHDAELIKKAAPHLEAHPEIKIMAPEKAMLFTLEKIKDGEDVISVTGNVLRDYLTDYFPILGVGNSSQMVSQVSLLAGGQVLETGSAGTAPKLAESFIENGILQWSSLGEIFALEEALRFEQSKYGNQKAEILADALQTASAGIVNDGPVDTRVQHFNLMLYMVRSLAEQGDDLEIKKHFSVIKDSLEKNEKKIRREIEAAVGKPAGNMGGHFDPDPEKVNAIMQPSATLNNILKQNFVVAPPAQMLTMAL